MIYYIIHLHDALIELNCLNLIELNLKLMKLNVLFIYFNI